MAKLVILFERELRIENLALKVRNRESGSCPFTFEDLSELSEESMYKALLAGQTAEELDPDLSVRCQVKISEY